MKKIKTIATGSFYAGLIAISVTTVVFLHQQKAPTADVKGVETSQTQTEDKVIFIATRGQNVLEQLKMHASVEIKDSPHGPFADTVNGKKQEGKYWNFYINGTRIQKNAADYITNGGEKIEWKLE